MAWIGDSIKNDIYSDLYFNSEDEYFNAGILNLVNLADREKEDRQRIARRGNAESIKQRRINKGVKAFKRFWCFEDKYFKEPAVLKDQSGQELTQKERRHLIALNNRYDRLELEYERTKKQLKDLYGVDIVEETSKRITEEYNALMMLKRKYRL